MADHIRGMGVQLAEEAGEAGFVDAGTVATPDGRAWNADRFIIAVGGRASRLPIPGAEYSPADVTVPPTPPPCTDQLNVGWLASAAPNWSKAVALSDAVAVSATVALAVAAS